jgi:hypothetical protein
MPVSPSYNGTYNSGSCGVVTTDTPREGGAHLDGVISAASNAEAKTAVGSLLERNLLNNLLSATINTCGPLVVKNTHHHTHTHTHTHTRALWTTSSDAPTGTSRVTVSFTPLGFDCSAATASACVTLLTSRPLTMSIYSNDNTTTG